MLLFLKPKPLMKVRLFRFSSLIAKLDRSSPVVYDPVKDPNYLSFYAVDSLGARAQVVYRNSKPTELEHSDRVVLKGQMNGEVFECKEILLKCPSKYKDDPNQQFKEFEKPVATADSTKTY
jgi:cytochrome c-type biogenesis protein CcmE